MLGKLPGSLSVNQNGVLQGARKKTKKNMASRQFLREIIQKPFIVFPDQKCTFKIHFDLP